MAVGQVNRDIQIPGQLVTSAQPVSSDAVKNLVDSFRSGFITADDVISRIGPEAQAGKKAVLQQLEEYVSPGAIEARHASNLASTAQSNFQVKKTAADSDLISPAAALTGEQIAARRQLLPDQTALEIANLKLQRDMMFPTAILGYAAARLKGEWNEHQDAQGNTVKTKMNDLGEDVTPAITDSKGNEITPGSPLWYKYSHMARSPHEWLTSDEFPWSKLRPGAITSPTITPSNQGITTPPPYGPMDESGASNQSSLVSPSGGIMVKANVANTPPSVETVGADIKKQEPYLDWNSARAHFVNFEKEYNKAKALEGRADKPAIVAQDHKMITEALKIFTPLSQRAAQNEFSFEMIKHIPTYPDKIKHALRLTTGQEALTPDARNEVQELVYNDMNSKRQAIKPMLKQVASQRDHWAGIVKNGYYNSVLGEHEQDVLNGDLTLPPREEKTGAHVSPPVGTAGGKKFIQVGPFQWKALGH